MRTEHNTQTESYSDYDSKELVSELSAIREGINRLASAAKDQQKQDVYRILALRLAETERHLGAITISQEPESEFSVGEILDSIDEELVVDGEGARLERRDQS